MDTIQIFEPRHIRTGSLVRLTRPIPELALTEGRVGIVRGFLPGPTDAYEVEFHRLGNHVPARTLLLGTQIEPQHGPLLTEDRVAAFQW